MLLKDCHFMRSPRSPTVGSPPRSSRFNDNSIIFSPKDWAKGASRGHISWRMASVRDKESLMEEIAQLKEAIQMETSYLSFEKSHGDVLLSENRKLIKDLEDLEARGKRAPRTGDLSKLNSLVNVAKVKVTELQSTSFEQQAELVTLRRNTRLTCNREIEAERDVLILEIARLQELIGRLKEEQCVLLEHIKEIPAIKDKISRLQITNTRLEAHINMARNDLTKTQAAIGVVRQKAKDYAIRAKAETEALEKMKEVESQWMEQVEQAERERLKIAKVVQGLKLTVRKVERSVAANKPKTPLSLLEQNDLAQRLREEEERRARQEQETARAREIALRAKRNQDLLKAQLDQEVAKRKKQEEEALREKEEAALRAKRELEELRAKMEQDALRTKKDAEALRLKQEQEHKALRAKLEQDSLRAKEEQDATLRAQLEDAALKARAEEEALRAQEEEEARLQMEASLRLQQEQDAMIKKLQEDALKAQEEAEAMRLRFEREREEEEARRRKEEEELRALEEEIKAREREEHMRLEEEERQRKLREQDAIDREVRRLLAEKNLMPELQKATTKRYSRTTTRKATIQKSSMVEIDVIRKPSIDDRKPNIDDRKPSIDDSTDMADRVIRKPSIDDRKSSIDDHTHMADPVIRKPSIDDHTRMVDPDATSRVERSMSIRGDWPKISLEDNWEFAADTRQISQLSHY